MWLVDTAGDVNPASSGRASFGFDNTTPGRPTSLKATPSSTGKSFEIRATAPAHLAPIASVNWVACKSGGRCTSAQNATGEAFRFDPATNATFRAAPHGRYVLRVWLEDAAGNTSSSSDATITATYPATNSAKSSSRIASPLLRITAVTVHGRDLRVAGTASRMLNAHVRITEHYDVATAHHILRRTAKAAAGRFSTEFVQPRGAHAERVSVSFVGGKHVRAETVTRAVADR
jgi:hypothetical protein